jgi:hypothetical protein
VGDGRGGYRDARARARVRGAAPWPEPPDGALLAIKGNNSQDGEKGGSAADGDMQSEIGP